jgi:hypothetical protein
MISASAKNREPAVSINRRIGILRYFVLFTLSFLSILLLLMIDGRQNIIVKQKVYFVFN